MNRQIARGFTLIELLVVVAIIGILGAILFASLNSGRAKARDTKRSQDVKALEGALEVYFANNGQYPADGTDNVGNLISTLQPILAPQYIQSVPQDPMYAGLSSTQGDYQYVRGSAGSYGIWVYLETGLGTVPAGTRCVTGVNVNSGWWASGSTPPTCPF